MKQESITCPELENHQWLKATFVKKNNAWELKEKAGKIELNEGNYSIEATSGKIDLTILPDKITINAESNPIIRYFVAPVFSLGFSWRLLILVVLSIILLALDIGLFFICSFSIFLAVTLCFLFFYNDATAIYTHKKIEVSRTNFSITETNRIFLKEDQPEVLSDIRAILPGKKANDILILYGRKPLRCKRILLRAAKSEPLHPRVILTQAILPSLNQR